MYLQLCLHTLILFASNSAPTTPHPTCCRRAHTATQPHARVPQQQHCMHASPSLSPPHRRVAARQRRGASLLVVIPALYVRIFPFIARRRKHRTQSLPFTPPITSRPTMLPLRLLGTRCRRAHEDSGCCGAGRDWTRVHGAVPWQQPGSGHAAAGAIVCGAGAERHGSPLRPDCKGSDGLYSFPCGAVAKEVGGGRGGSIRSS